jgi:hypothetical protein
MASASTDAERSVAVLLENVDRRLVQMPAATLRMGLRVLDKMTQQRAKDLTRTCFGFAKNAMGTILEGAKEPGQSLCPGSWGTAP